MDKHMVDNEDQRDDRAHTARGEGEDQMGRPLQRSIPNRMQRRQIAKRRGVFKHAGLWPHINNRASNRPQEGDRNSEENN